MPIIVYDRYTHTVEHDGYCSGGGGEDTGPTSHQSCELEISASDLKIMFDNGILSIDEPSMTLDDDYLNDIPEIKSLNYRKQHDAYCSYDYYSLATNGRVTLSTAEIFDMVFDMAYPVSGMMNIEQQATPTQINTLTSDQIRDNGVQQPTNDKSVEYDILIDNVINAQNTIGLIELLENPQLTTSDINDGLDTAVFIGYTEGVGLLLEDPRVDPSGFMSDYLESSRENDNTHIVRLLEMFNDGGRNDGNTYSRDSYIGLTHAIVLNDTDYVRDILEDPEVPLSISPEQFDKLSKLAIGRANTKINQLIVNHISYEDY